MDRLRPPRPHLPDPDRGRGRRAPDLGLGHLDQLPPALLPRRGDHRLRVGPGRTEQPVDHGCGWRQSSGGLLGQCPTGRGARVDAGRTVHRGPRRQPVDDTRRAGSFGLVDVPSGRWRGHRADRRVRRGVAVRLFRRSPPLLPRPA